MKTLKNVKDETLTAYYLPVLSSHSARQSVTDPLIKRGRLHRKDEDETSKAPYLLG